MRNFVNTCLEFGRGQITERPLNPLPVVVDLNELERSHSHVLDALPRVQVDELFLERRIPRFRSSIIETDPGLPDRGYDSARKASVTERLAGILTSPVRVENDIPDTGLTFPHRHHESFDNQLLPHMAGDSPPDHLPREPVDN